MSVIIMVDGRENGFGVKLIEEESGGAIIYGSYDEAREAMVGHMCELCMLTFFNVDTGEYDTNF